MVITLQAIRGPPGSAATSGGRGRVSLRWPCKKNLGQDVSFLENNYPFRARRFWKVAPIILKEPLHIRDGKFIYPGEGWTNSSEVKGGEMSTYSTHSGVLAGFNFWAYRGGREGGVDDFVLVIAGAGTFGYHVITGASLNSSEKTENRDQEGRRKDNISLIPR